MPLPPALPDSRSEFNILVFSLPPAQIFTLISQVVTFHILPFLSFIHPFSCFQNHSLKQVAFHKGNITK